jgi:hypothetical protein
MPGKSINETIRNQSQVQKNESIRELDRTIQEEYRIRVNLTRPIERYEVLKYIGRGRINKANSVMFTWEGT